VYQPGDTFDVSVLVSTDSAVNAVSAVISFPSDTLEVAGVSKAGTLLTLWTLEPNYSNANGRVNFEGVMLSPGFTGDNGKILTVTFKALAFGAPAVTFASAAVLANDGRGTNILTSLGNAQYTVGTGAPPAAEDTTGNADSAPTGVPAAPTVTSSTHADPNGCYALPDATFNWNLPYGAIGVNFYGDQNPTTDPGTRADGLFRNWTFEDVEDGQWYFHLRLQNEFGWGPTTHFPFCIDTVAPVIASFEAGDATTDEASRAVLTAEASDVGSGIAGFEVTIDGGAALEVESDSLSAADPFYVQLPAGEHAFGVVALDRAGNRSEALVSSAVVSEASDTKNFVPFRPATPASAGFPTLWEYLRSQGQVMAMLSLAGTVVLLILLLSLWHLLATRRRRMQADLGAVDETFHESFLKLREELHKQIAKLEKIAARRRLTSLERLSLAKLEDNLVQVERRLHDELKKLAGKTR
jgi:hypothetical protein